MSHFFTALRWLAVVLSAGGSVVTAQVTVTWQAASTNGLGDAGGTPLPTGSLVRLGTFNISPATIQANAGNYAFLNANFVAFDATAVGTGSGAEGIDGYWTRVSPSTSTDSLGLAGAQMYLWAFNATTAASAIQQGIFTSSLGTWRFPSNASVPSTAEIDLNEVTSSILGGFGTGTSSATGSAQPLFNLAAIPEPADAAVIAAAGALVLVCYRRRLRLKN